MKQQYWQQGDVLLKPASIPQDAKERFGRVLREGEATGHAHVAVADDVKLFIVDDTLFMSAPSGTTVVHEEHGPIEVPPGDYRIDAVQEFDHFAEEAREVID